MVDRLKQETKSLEGIGLYCRRDYDVNHIGSKFGFEAVNSKTGRGEDGAELTFWWFSHGHEDLFSRVAEPDPTRQRVVTDANVFFDIYFAGLIMGYAIQVGRRWQLPEPVPLKSLRKRRTGFRPPQSYHYWNLEELILVGGEEFSERIGERHRLISAGRN